MKFAIRFALSFRVAVAALAVWTAAGCGSQAKTFPDQPKGSAKDSPWFHIPISYDGIVVVNAKVVLEEIEKIVPGGMDYPREVKAVFKTIGFDPRKDLGAVAVGLNESSLPQRFGMGPLAQTPDVIAVARVKLDVEAAYDKLYHWQMMEAPKDAPNVSLEAMSEGDAPVWLVTVEIKEGEESKTEKFYLGQSGDFLYLATKKQGVERAMEVGAGKAKSIVEHETYRPALVYTNQDAALWGVLPNFDPAVKFSAFFLDLGDPLVGQGSLQSFTPVGARDKANDARNALQQLRSMASMMAPVAVEIIDGISVATEGNNAIFTISYTRQQVERFFREAQKLKTP
jgi:hypothetical protein